MNDDEMNRGKKKGFLMSITQKTNAAPKKKDTRKQNENRIYFFFSRGYAMRAESARRCFDVVVDGADA